MKMGVLDVGFLNPGDVGTGLLGRVRSCCCPVEGDLCHDASDLASGARSSRRFRRGRYTFRRRGRTGWGGGEREEEERKSMVWMWRLLWLSSSQHAG